MSQGNKGIAQYKDALKLLNKKVQGLEAQCAKIKAQNDSMAGDVYSFLESLSKPFNDTNTKPELTIEALTTWWVDQGRGEKTPGTSQVIVNDHSALKSELDELKIKYSELEKERNNLEYTLSRRQDELISANDTNNSTKEELDQLNSEKQDLQSRYARLEANMKEQCDQFSSLFVQISDLIGADQEKAERMKQATLESIKAQCSSPNSGMQLLSQSLSTLVDHIASLKFASQREDSVASTHQQLIEAQEAHIKEMEKSEEKSRDELDRLKRRVQTLEAAAAGDEELEEQLEEMEATNESLRSALRCAKENMEQQMARQRVIEEELMRLQQELVGVQQHSNTLVQQALQTNETKIAELERKLSEGSGLLARKEEELSGLRETWERSVGQYEQELAVLRARKVAVEQQVTVSEKFLEDHNRVHKEEVEKLQTALQTAQEETQELRCLVLEREAELEASQQTGEDTVEQLRGQIASLSEQVRAMQGKLSSQQSNVASVKKREAELEGEMKEKLAASIQEMEEKDREIIRQQQKNYEDELVRMRNQVSVLTHQLEEERKGGKKMRDTVSQLNELFEGQDRQIEILRSDVAMRDSELLAGKEQIKKLSMLLSSKLSAK